MNYSVFSISFTEMISLKANVTSTWIGYKHYFDSIENVRKYYFRRESGSGSFHVFSTRILHYFNIIKLFVTYVDVSSAKFI